MTAPTSADKVAHEERSRIMRAVRGSGTKAEFLMRQLLRRFRLRFSEQRSDLPGRPDFVNDWLRIVIFVDGDFWHGRWWRRGGKLPVANRAYWQNKLRRNAERDRSTDRNLRRKGWSVIRVWESELLRDPAGVTTMLTSRFARRRRLRAERRSE